MNAGVAEEDVKKIFRLGKLGDRPEPCPILVQLNNRVAKNLIMESAYKLGSMEQKFKSVIIAHDMTKLERSQCKEFVQEAKERTQNDSGDFIYRVRGQPGHMGIVRIPKNR